LHVLALKIEDTEHQAWLRVENRLSEKEQIWLEGCLKGKASAQEMLYKHFYGYVMSIAMRYVATTDERKEVVNDSFLKVFTRIQQYDPDKPFKTWLRRIVINTAIDYLRVHHKHPREEEITPVTEKALQSDIIDQLHAEDILKLLTKLPEQYRLVFNLYELEGYAHAEIADMLEITESSSRSVLTRAKAKLRSLVEEMHLEKFGKATASLTGRGAARQE
jgi:RNA polymerase sigma-70 factor (ECF subfamily)